MTLGQILSTNIGWRMSDIIANLTGVVRRRNLASIARFSKSVFIARVAFDD